MEHPYNLKLEEIGFGKPFMMVNYKGIFIRVYCPDLKMICGVFEQEEDFNGGHHVPIVELRTGRLFHMSKEKPVFIYPGEDKK